MNDNNKKPVFFRNICIISIIAFLAVSIFYFSDAIPSFLRSAMQSGKYTLLLVLISSVIDSINPCAFSVLILTIAFLMSLGRDRNTILRIGGVYVFGIFLTYVFIGLGILQALQFLNVPHFMAKMGAVVLIIVGSINIINDFFPSFPIKIKIPQFAHKRIANLMEKGTLPAIFLLGIMVGLYEFPCTGGPYLMILGLLHDKETYLSGFLYLVLYNFIFVLPLLTILLISSSRTVLKKVQEWKGEESRNMRFYGGIATIILGVIIFFL